LPPVWKADDEELAALAGSDTVLYTPEIVNSPNVVANGVKHLCASLRSIKQEPQRRADRDTAKARIRSGRAAPRNQSASGSHGRCGRGGARRIGDRDSLKQAFVAKADLRCHMAGISTNPEKAGPRSAWDPDDIVVIEDRARAGARGGDVAVLGSPDDPAPNQGPNTRAQIRLEFPARALNNQTPSN
jgi:hypothetical protein